MLSILIPTYNTDIRGLVSKLLEQLGTASNEVEIVFCEDGSTEYLKQNITIVTNENVTRVVNETNLGRTATRSILSKAATYEWLLFLDADVQVINDNFITEYLKSIDKEIDIISGGTSYNRIQPKNKSLRWKFGVERESRTASERQKTPSYIISQNLLIRKSIFGQLNTITTRHYGLDNIFSYQIMKNKFRVKHIDNPILHCGLESNDQFLTKSKEAIATLIYFENKKKLSQNFTRLQKASLKLKKSGFSKIVTYIIKKNIASIEENLISENPSLFLFDIYRLYHYSILKKNA